MPRKIETRIREFFEEILFRSEEGSERFTQDSPIYPDVWFRFLEVGVNERVDLILTPHKESSSRELIQAIYETLCGASANQVNRLTSSGGMIVCELNFRELLRCLMFTNWWSCYLWDEDGRPKSDWIWLTKIIGAVVSIKTLRAAERKEDFSPHEFCQIGFDEVKKLFPDTKFPDPSSNRNAVLNTGARRNRTQICLRKRRRISHSYGRYPSIGRHFVL